MKIYKDGMTLMRDTGSLTNAIMENCNKSVKVGDTFVELLWTDRELYIVTAVESPTRFRAKTVKTVCKTFEEGTMYPVLDENGKMETEGDEEVFFKARKYWYREINNNNYHSKVKVHFSWGEKTGYRDPCF